MPLESRMSLVERVHLVLTCCSITANTLCAGGVFTFPILAPALASQLKLTQPQLTTIVLAGMVGQYPFAALAGKAIDQYGSWACSFAASFLYFTGFGLFSREVSNASKGTVVPSSERLVFFFFLAGLGTLLSFFSSLFAAAKNFPQYAGIASGTSMALYSLSPLFLSVLASTFFTNDETGLDVPRFVAMLALLAGSVHFVGGFFLYNPPIRTIIESEVLPSSDSSSDDEVFDRAEIDERAPLVPGKSVVQVSVHPVDASHSTFDLLQDPYFWALFVVVMFLIGSCEMIIANIGSIVVSLPPSSASHDGAPVTLTTATQVRLLSLSNTITRLLVGPIADFVSPIACYHPSGTVFFTRKHYISRLAFLSVPCILLIITFGWMDIGVRSYQGLWTLSIGTGIAYGIIFPILPTIMSSVWGLANLGRNFGIISYAAFFGTTTFSYMYAFIAAAQQDEGSDVCEGVRCWKLTFALSTITALLALIGTLGLWRHWKGKL